MANNEIDIPRLTQIEATKLIKALARTKNVAEKTGEDQLVIIRFNPRHKMWSTMFSESHQWVKVLT
jgi:hypothetical protein